MTDATGALRGLRVVDLTTNLTTAFTSLLFADFGAEVIQVEPPGGATLRRHRSWPFWMRGKKSYLADYGNADDLALVQALAAEADVVIEAFRPGVADRLGLGYGDLSNRNPGLVYTSITGFGPGNRYSNLKCYEAVVMAKTGSMYGPNRSGRAGPVIMKTPGATFAGSFLAMQGTLLALHERTRHGHGQRVDATMIQGMMAQDPWTYFAKVLAKLYPDSFSGVMPAPSTAAPVPTTWLTFGLLIGYSKDGRWMQFAHATPKQFESFVKELGLEWARRDPKWADAPNSDDVNVRNEWWTMMLSAVRDKTVAEWQAVFDRNSDTFAEIFRAPEELFDHPQVLHDHHRVEVDHAGLGHVRQMASLVKMEGTPPVVTNPPPQPGEHNDELRARPRRELPVAKGAPDDRPPLDGMLVVDLGTFYAGPFGSTMLTDHGARVIHLEPLDGDPIRYQMPIPEWAGVRVTQGKESLAVDAYSQEGAKIVTELLRRADVVLHTYRGGVAKKMGVDVDSVRKINPDIVYHHAQGYGVDGPYARRAAFAPTIAAGSGFSRRSGGGGVEGVELTIDEIKANTAFTAGAQSGHPDGFAALGSAVGIALGVLARDLGNGSQSTMTSMLSTMGHVLSEILVEYEGAPAPLEPDPELYGFSALYRLYPASQGWVVLCVTTDGEWDALARALELPADLRTDEAKLIATLTERFSTATATEWEQRLVAADIACVEVVANLGGLSSGALEPGGLGEQLGLTTTVEHPLFGEHIRTNALVTLSRSRQTLRPGCLVGQHSDQILSELGYSAERIAELRAAGIVGG